MKKFLLMLAFMSFIASAEDIEYKAGDLLSIGINKGNFVLLLWGNAPLWYDSQNEIFTTEPVRNYGTINVDITRKTPAGDYQFLEIDAVDNPKDLNNWRWIRATGVRVIQCNGFRIC